MTDYFTLACRKREGGGGVKVNPKNRNVLPALKEIHIVKLVQLHRKLQCSLYFRHDIIPLITCQTRGHLVSDDPMTEER